MEVIFCYEMLLNIYSSCYLTCIICNLYTSNHTMLRLIAENHIFSSHHAVSRWQLTTPHQNLHIERQLFTLPHISSIHILCSTDKNYAAYCGVMLTSVLESNPRNRFVIHILTDGLSEEDTLRFHQLSARYGCIIDIHTLTPQHLSGLPERIGKWPRSICFRLFAPDILPPEVTRVIYLDCDIIVDTDLAPLWQTDLTGMACGAVTEEEGHNSDLMLGVLNVVHNLDPGRRYFNSGVMVMDFAMIRAAGLHHKALELIRRKGSSLSCPDQDALNIVMRHQWKELSLRWNVQSRFFLKNYFKLLRDEDRELMLAIASRRLRGIIHFTGTKHPWDKDSLHFHPFWYKWDRHLRRSPWRKNCRITHAPTLRSRIAINKLKFMRRFSIPSTYDLIWIDTAHK